MKKGFRIGVERVDGGASSLSVPLVRRAVTLIELMVAVVIIGIVSGITYPQLTRITAYSNLDGDAGTLFNDIQWTRMNAVQSGGSLRIVFADTVLGGHTTKNWKIYQLVKNSGTPVTYQSVLVRTGVLSPTSLVGLPTSVAAPTTSVSNVFSGLSAVSGGFQGASGALAVCTDGSSETWADGIKFCGGTTSDVETGSVYLYTYRGTSRVYAIAFNRSKSLAPMRFRYMGGWDRI